MSSLSSTVHSSGPHPCCTQVTHFALSGLAMPRDHSTAASATTGQQLLSVSEFRVPGDERIDSRILYELGHRAFVFGSSA